MPIIDVQKFCSDFHQANIDESIALALQARATIWNQSKSDAARKTYAGKIRKEFNLRLRRNVCYWPRELDIDEYVILVKNHLEQWLTIYDDLECVKTLILLSILRLSPSEQAQFMQDSVAQRKRDMQPETRRYIYIEKFLTVSESLLDSASYLKRILGLSALTGRRTAEIAMSATFEPIDDYHVVFAGQKKTGDREDVEPYSIPLLCESKKAIDALSSIRRDKPEFSTMEYSKVHNRLSSELSKIVKKEYAGVAVINSEPCELSAKSLRAIYAEICFYFHRNLEGGKPLYFAEILGHSEHDISTALAYDDFHLIRE